MNIDDPEVDAATLQQMAYNSNFTEDINIRMRVPETITVESTDQQDQYKQNPPNFYHPSIESKLEARRNGAAAMKMEVPDRIIVSVGKDGVQYNHGEVRTPSPVYMAYNPIEPVSLKTPPRVLTLQDHHLDDFDSQLTNDEPNIEETSLQGQSSVHISNLMECETMPSLSNRKNRPTNLDLSYNITQSKAVRVHDKSTKGSLLRNLQNESKNFYHTIVNKLQCRSSEDGYNSENNWLEYSENDGADVVFVCCNSPCPSVCCKHFSLPTSVLTDSEELDEVTLMRKQVYKLHKRLVLLEEEQAIRSRRDYIVYGVTAALWLLNGWFLYSHRRLY